MQEKKEIKRIQITLPYDVYEFLEKVNEKYGIPKSSSISILIQKYGKEEFGSVEK